MEIVAPAKKDLTPLERVIRRNMQAARDRILVAHAKDEYGEQNLNALIAFEAMRTAEQERHNLRSMQAWLAIKVAKDKLYLSYPPSKEYPDGFGDMREWLTAVGIGRSSVYELYHISTTIAPLLDEHNIKIENYLNSDKYPKLAEAVPTLRRIAEGEEAKFTVEEIIKDVETAQNRDDMRAKYRDERYLADGAVNKLGNGHSTLAIIAPDENIASLLRGLQGKVEWHLSVTTEEQNHEVVIRVPR